jgi:enamine deaminase RidA (YjgF/YER057c/UK114 family)
MQRRIINPWKWQDPFGFVQANEISGPQRILICSGQTSIDADGRVAHTGDMGAQVEAALDNLETVLQEAGFQFSDVVRLNWYTTDVDLFRRTAEIRAGRLAKAGCRPASTLLGVSRLAYPELLVEVEATAAA